MNGKINNNIKEIFYNNLCNQCIEILIEAYKLSQQHSIYSDDWEEDDFTALLVDEYMEKVPLKYKECWFVAPQRPFYSEIHLKGEEQSKKAPRPDIRFEKYIFSNPIPFKYTIEAKILKSNSSRLKRRYITTGIDNFKTKRYPEGCLAGYIIKCKTRDCVVGINKLLLNDKRDQELLMHSKLIDGFEDSYNSSHNNGSFTLKHVFLEF